LNVMGVQGRGNVDLLLGIGFRSFRFLAARTRWATVSIIGGWFFIVHPVADR
jgi:hypothetical protein